MTTAIVYITNTTLDPEGIRMVDIVRFGNKDALTPPACGPWGVDSNPVKDIGALYTESSVKGAPALIGYFLKDQKAAVGETRIYATNAAGAEQARIWLHTDGTVELGGTGAAGTNTNHAAQYEGLQTAFDQLKSDFNDLVTKYNAHVHILTLTAGTGTAAPTATTDSPSTADITGAKLENIKTE